MRIEERHPCPRCGQRRVVQRSRTAFMCFQCRYGWSLDAPAPAQYDTPVFFLPHEWQRLIAYRAAIRAGLYSDWS
jgi:ribosomal protein L37AE/L43A